MANTFAFTGFTTSGVVADVVGPPRRFLLKFHLIIRFFLSGLFAVTFVAPKFALLPPPAVSGEEVAAIRLDLALLGCLLLPSLSCRFLSFSIFLSFLAFFRFSWFLIISILSFVSRIDASFVEIILDRRLRRLPVVGEFVSFPSPFVAAGISNDDLLLAVLVVSTFVAVVDLSLAFAAIVSASDLGGEYCCNCDNDFDTGGGPTSMFPTICNMLGFGDNNGDECEGDGDSVFSRFSELDDGCFAGKALKDTDSFLRPLPPPIESPEAVFSIEEADDDCDFGSDRNVSVLSFCDVGILGEGGDGFIFDGSRYSC